MAHALTLVAVMGLGLLVGLSGQVIAVALFVGWLQRPAASNEDR